MKYDNTNETVLNECHNLFTNLKLIPGKTYHFEKNKWYNLMKFQFAFNYQAGTLADENLL